MTLDCNYVDSLTGITTLKSKDNKIRFYTWNTNLGGTWEQYATVAEYRT